MHELDGYDLEYAEVAAAHWEKATSEVEMWLLFPIRKSFLKRQADRLAGLLGIRDGLSEPWDCDLVYLRFLGIENVRESLISDGPEQFQSNIDNEDWQQIIRRSAHFEIDELRSVARGGGVSRLYLEAEQRILEFDYREVIVRAIGFRTDASS